MGIINKTKEWAKTSLKSENLFKGYPAEGVVLKETDEETITFGVWDTETTGRNVDPNEYDQSNPNRSEITEFAIRKVTVEKSTFEFVEIGEMYNEFSEPSDLSKITPEITRLTGITAEMVKGKIIDWDKVNKMFSECDFILAHNSNFDDNVVHFNKTVDVKSYCSYNSLEWKEKLSLVDSEPFYNSQQETIALECGFHYSAHRAIFDVDALINVFIKTGWLKELVENAQKPEIVISGWVGNRFKDYCKNELDMKFNNDDKSWRKRVSKDKVSDAKSHVLQKAKELCDSRFKPESVKVKFIDHD